VGDANNEEQRLRIEGDTNNDGTPDAGETWVYEWVDQPTMFEVDNTYAVMMGQAQVVKSVTTSWNATLSGSVFTKNTVPGTHNYSRSVTTVNYTFNGKGQLTGAVGRTVGEGNNEVKTPKRLSGGGIEGDTNNDGTPDAGETWVYEWVDQPTMFEVDNTYAVMMGQAQVVKSVTTSWNATLSGSVFTKNTVPGTHNYSRSVTTVNYTFNGKGQLTGVVGRTVGEGNNEVKTPKRLSGGGIEGDTNNDGTPDAGETWVYEWVDQPTMFEVDNTYRGDYGSSAGGEERDDELERDVEWERVHEEHGAWNAQLQPECNDGKLHI
jgi:hypothetical protein